jgi:hypothetical protein
MGLKSSPCAFLAAFYDLFRTDLRTNFSVYVDDGLIYHADFGQHLSFLRHIFAKLRAAKLRINPKKSLFARDRLVFLGFLLTPDGIQVDPKRFQKIRDLQPPTNQKQTKILIGFLAYYRKFLKGFSALSAPLRMLLRKDAVFEWTEVHDQALQKMKDALLENVVLLYPDMNKTFHIQTDASKMAAAHVLLQEHEGSLRPIAFGGRAFKQHESKLSATDLELLAILDALKAYHQFISNGRRFVIRTDHCSLKFLQNLEHAANPKLVRYSMLLQHFDYEIVHVKGTDNLIPDFLSRYPMKDSVETVKQTESEPDPLSDVDHFGYLNAIDVKELYPMKRMEDGAIAKDRKHKFRTYHIMPVRQKVSERTNSARRVRRKRDQNSDALSERLTQTSRDQSNGNHSHIAESNSDSHLMDEETRLVYSDIQQQLTPAINLVSQGDDPFMQAVILFLQEGRLPEDKALARMVLLQSDDFFISQDQLFHLARVKNTKRLHSIIHRFQQLVIPKSFRMQLMQAVHEASHFAFLKCYLTARQKFYWRGMATDFEAFTKSCLVCQQLRNSKPPHYPLQSIPVTQLFDTLMIDFHEVRQDKSAGADAYKYVLVCIDQFSQFVSMIATKDQKAETAAKAIMDNIILKFGCFRYLVSDRSRSWLNNLFQEFLKMPNMAAFHIKTSSFHPQTNSLCEQQNKHILRHLRAFCTDRKNFHEFLPAICAAINGTVNSMLGVEPYFLLYGQSYRWPIETSLTSQDQSLRESDYPASLQSLAERLKVVRAIVHENIKDARANTERIRNVGAKPDDFEIGQRVFVAQEFESSKIQNRKHTVPFVGPYSIVDKRGPLVRLSHFYTGRLLKNWVNVCKLRKLNDEPRHVLYNRLRSDPTNSTTVENVAQRTVQTADTDAVQCAMNARDKTHSFVGVHGPRSIHAVQQPDTPGESFMEDCRRSAVVPWLVRVDGQHAQSGLRTSQARCQLREVQAFSSQLTVPRCAVGRVDADAVTDGSCGRAPARAQLMTWSVMTTRRGCSELGRAHRRLRSVADPVGVQQMTKYGCLRSLSNGLLTLRL